MNTSVEARIFRLVGLGIRGRGAVVGVQQVREGVKHNTVHLALVATDASANSRDKIVPLLNARRVRFIEVPSASTLGAAVGREHTAVVGIVDPRLATGILDLVMSDSVRPREEGV